MLGYMNTEAFEKTIQEQRVTFFSRSKNRLWTKGETSGNFLHVVSMEKDCDTDALLIHVNPDGPICHRNTNSCFDNGEEPWGIYDLDHVIADRQKNPIEGSYTNKLLSAGINKVAQKVGEEAVELVIEAKDNAEHLFLNEAADLMFHYLVLLRAKGYSLQDVERILKQRHKK